MNIHISAWRCEATVIRSQPCMWLERSESAQEHEQRTVLCTDKKKQSTTMSQPVSGVTQPVSGVTQPVNSEHSDLCMLWSYSHSFTAIHATRAQWISWRERAENSAIYIYIYIHKEKQPINNPTSCGTSTLLQKIIYSQQVAHKVITYVQRFCQHIDRFSFVDDFISDVVVS